MVEQAIDVQTRFKQDWRSPTQGTKPLLTRAEKVFEGDMVIVYLR